MIRFIIVVSPIGNNSAPDNQNNMQINTINEKHIVEFDKGRFDGWCVYLKRHGQNRYAPVDEEYFTFFKSMAAKYGTEKVYNDFVQVYNATSSQHSPTTVAMIKQIATTYNEDSEEAEIWFSIIYGGMIAEENKTGMILKKRIKRLGMHQVLFDNYEPRVAAKFSFGKKMERIK